MDRSRGIGGAANSINSETLKKSTAECEYLVPILVYCLLAGPAGSIFLILCMFYWRRRTPEGEITSACFDVFVPARFACTARIKHVCLVLHDHYSFLGVALPRRGLFNNFLFCATECEQKTYDRRYNIYTVGASLFHHVVDMEFSVKKSYKYSKETQACSHA